MEMKYDVEAWILKVWDMSLKRNDIAVFYANLMRFLPAISPAWASVNNAILQRWSGYGLEYIKAKAWKIIKEGDRGGDESLPKRLSGMVGPESGPRH